MALSVIVIPGDGVTTQFNIPFALGYIKESDITARVGDEVDGAGNPVYRELTFLSTEIVEVGGPPAQVGQDIVFQRTVDREQLIVDFEDGDIINEENMNTAQKQAIMIAHEALDGRFFDLDVAAMLEEVKGYAETAQEAAVVATTAGARYKTLAAVSATVVAPTVETIKINDYATFGDRGGATYVRTQSEPTHTGKIQSLDGAWWELSEDTVYPEMFGAVVDSVTDDTQAIQRAADYCTYRGLGSLNFRAYKGKSYIVKDTITYPALLLDGVPGASIMAVDMTGDVFVNTGATSVGRVMGARMLELIVSGSNVRNFVSGPKQSDQYFTYYTAYLFDHVYCRGQHRVATKYSFGWDFGASAWLKVGDCVGCTITNNKVQGAFDIITDPEPQIKDVAFHFDAASAVLSGRLYGNEVGPIYRGVLIQDRTFIQITGCDFIGTYDGIVWDGVTMFNEPKISKCNINAQRWGISIDGPDSIEFIDNTVRRHRSGWKGATHDWVGIRAYNVADLKVSGNTVQPDEGGGEFSGTLYGYDFTLSSLAVVNGNFVGVGCDVGICLTDMTGVVVDNTTTAQNGSTDILYLCLGNTGTRRTELGSVAYVSTFSGTVIVKSAASAANAITMGNATEDIQSTGNITQTVTRVNAATDSKVWRDTVGTSSRSRAILSDSGTSANYEIVTRIANVVDQIEWRASRFKLNNGPTITISAATPEGTVTAPPGSLHINTSTSGRLYVKQSGTGNTGWVEK